MTRELLEELIWYAEKLRTEWALRKAIRYIQMLIEAEEGRGKA